MRSKALQALGALAFICAMLGVAWVLFGDSESAPRVQLEDEAGEREVDLERASPTPVYRVKPDAPYDAAADRIATYASTRDVVESLPLTTLPALDPDAPREFARRTLVGVEWSIADDLGSPQPLADVLGGDALQMQAELWGTGDDLRTSMETMRSQELSRLRSFTLQPFSESGALPQWVENRGSPALSWGARTLTYFELREPLADAEWKWKAGSPALQASLSFSFHFLIGSFDVTWTSDLKRERIGEHEFFRIELKLSELMAQAGCLMRCDLTSANGTPVDALYFRSWLSVGDALRRPKDGERAPAEASEPGPRTRAFSADDRVRANEVVQRGFAHWPGLGWVSFVSRDQFMPRVRLELVLTDKRDAYLEGDTVMIASDFGRRSLDYALLDLGEVRLARGAVVELNASLGYLSPADKLRYEEFAQSRSRVKQIEQKRWYLSLEEGEAKAFPLDRDLRLWLPDAFYPLQATYDAEWIGERSHFAFAPQLQVLELSARENVKLQLSFQQRWFCQISVGTYDESNLASRIAWRRGSEVFSEQEVFDRLRERRVVRRGSPFNLTWRDCTQDMQAGEGGAALEDGDELTLFAVTGTYKPVQTTIIFGETRIVQLLAVEFWHAQEDYLELYEESMREYTDALADLGEREVELEIALPKWRSSSYYGIAQLALEWEGLPALLEHTLDFPTIEYTMNPRKYDQVCTWRTTLKLPPGESEWRVSLSLKFPEVWGVRPGVQSEVKFTLQRPADASELIRVEVELPRMADLSRNVPIDELTHALSCRDVRASAFAAQVQLEVEGDGDPVRAFVELRENAATSRGPVWEYVIDGDDLHRVTSYGESRSFGGPNSEGRLIELEDYRSNRRRSRVFVSRRREFGVPARLSLDTSVLKQRNGELTLLLKRSEKEYFELKLDSDDESWGEPAYLWLSEGPAIFTASFRAFDGLSQSFEAEVEIKADELVELAMPKQLATALVSVSQAWPASKDDRSREPRWRFVRKNPSAQEIAMGGDRFERTLKYGEVATLQLPANSRWVILPDYNWRMSNGEFPPPFEVHAKADQQSSVILPAIVPIYYSDRRVVQSQVTLDLPSAALEELRAHGKGVRLEVEWVPHRYYMHLASGASEPGVWSRALSGDELRVNSSTQQWIQDGKLHLGDLPENEQYMLFVSLIVDGSGREKVPLASGSAAQPLEATRFSHLVHVSHRAGEVVALQPAWEQAAVTYALKPSPDAPSR